MRTVLFTSRFIYRRLKAKRGLSGEKTYNDWRKHCKLQVCLAGPKQLTNAGGRGGGRTPEAERYE